MQEFCCRPTHCSLANVESTFDACGLQDQSRDMDPSSLQKLLYRHHCSTRVLVLILGTQIPNVL